MTTTNRTESPATRQAEIIASRYQGLKFTPPARPADRSKNGTRTPRSVRHKGLR